MHTTRPPVRYKSSMNYDPVLLREIKNRQTSVVGLQINKSYLTLFREIKNIRLSDTYEPVLRSAILFSEFLSSKSAKRIVNEQRTSFALVSIKWTEFSKMLHWLLQKCILKCTKKDSGVVCLQREFQKGLPEHMDLKEWKMLTVMLIKRQRT